MIHLTHSWGRGRGRPPPQRRIAQSTATAITGPTLHGPPQYTQRPSQSRSVQSASAVLHDGQQITTSHTPHSAAAARPSPLRPSGGSSVAPPIASSVAPPIASSVAPPIANSVAPPIASSVAPPIASLRSRHRPPHQCTARPDTQPERLSLPTYTALAGRNNGAPLPLPPCLSTASAVSAAPGDRPAGWAGWVPGPPSLRSTEERRRVQ